MFEYRIYEISTPTVSEGMLNELGQKHWELVTIVSWDNQWFYYFKRHSYAKLEGYNGSRIKRTTGAST